MKIVGSVGADEVPEGEGKANAVWQQLAQRAMADYRAGRVTQIEAEDRPEVTRMRNATLRYLRAHNFVMNPVIVKNDHGSLDVYLQLTSTEPETAPTTGRPRGRPPRNSSAPPPDTLGRVRMRRVDNL